MFNVYTAPDEPPAQLKLVRKGKKDTPGASHLSLTSETKVTRLIIAAQVFSESMITWAHLFHPNIMSVYGAFLEGEDGPVFLVSPSTGKENIAVYAKTLPQSARMPLVSDLLCPYPFLMRF
jgi:hypothetical protein